MLPVSAAYLDALHYGHNRSTACTYTQPGGVPVAVKVKAGSVTVDSTARTRRSSDLVVFGSTADYLAMMVPGTRFAVTHSIDLQGRTETVPVIVGEVNKGRQAFGGTAGEISIPLIDLTTWIQRSDFIEPFTIVSGTSRVDAIAAIITGAMPTALVSNLSTDAGKLGADKVYTGSRLDAISDLNSDGGTESFFGPSGIYIIRDQPTFATPPAWLITGLVKNGSRERPMDKLYNTVVVTPSATDGSQTWTQQVVQITDANHPRHPSKIGVVPYRLASPTASSAGAAYGAGLARLNRLVGNADTLDLDLIGNAALEGGDVIRVSIPAMNEEPAQIFQHIVDRYTLNFTTGGMSMNTRSQEVTA